MKKCQITFSLAFILTATTNLLAQSFEGKIQYNITYQQVPEMLQGMESMLPTTSTNYMKGKLIRTEVPMPMGGEQVVIFNSTKNEGVMLMDMMGTKMAVTMSSEYLKAEEEKLNMDDPDVKYFNEFKTIAGFKCQKATITQNGETLTVYFTEKIQNIGQNFNYIKGMPLEYNVSQNEVKSTLTASSVSYESIPQSLFEIPDGYDLTTIEELMKSTGGN